MRVASIKASDSDTDTGPESQMSQKGERRVPHATPTEAESVCPKITARGCETGASGTPKTRATDAPKLEINITGSSKPVKQGSMSGAMK